MTSRITWKTVVLVVGLSAALSAHAQPDESRYSKYDFGKLMKDFEISLKSDVPGVVESTIYNLVEYKSAFPDRDYSRQISALKKIARDHADSTLVYKANLAGMYLTYGTRIESASVFNPEYHETAFRVVAEQLVKKFLLSSSAE